MLGVLLGMVGVLAGHHGYRHVLKVPYATVDGKTLTLNAFYPESPTQRAPALVDIHGGWFMGGEPATDISPYLTGKGIAMFSIAYRLGGEGGFPECIRDCRNAVRFLRKNARRFNIDPDRIGVMGGSAGGHLSLMVAMVPEDFEDGGPTAGLEGVSARVCGCFSWIPPTDFVRFWNQGPDDVVTGPDGAKSFRPIDDIAPNDARPHLRSLFHGIAPDSPAHIALYNRMCPIGHVRKNVPPLLICDGEKDPIVPGIMGKELDAQLRKVGADSTYWLTVGGDHAYPSGPGFDALLDRFLNRIFRID